MKTKIVKPLVMVLCAILLVVGTVAGTVAYLQDQESAKNTFTVGTVAITLTEANPPAEGKYHLVPGRTYANETKITVEAGSENCYVFFKLKNDLGADATFAMDENWTALEGVNNVYYYKVGDNAIVSAGTECVVFESFTLSTLADLTGVTSETAIEVNGYAVQAETFANAKAAWDGASFQ